MVELASGGRMDSSVVTVALDVGGMKCAGCVKVVEEQLQQSPGVIKASVNLVTEMAVVQGEEGTLNPEVLAEQLTAVGFPSQARSTDSAVSRESPAERRRQEQQQQIRQMAIASVLLFFSAIGHLPEWGGPTLPLVNHILFHWGLATLALLLPGRSILVDGWKGFRRRAPNMNSLVGLGTLTAYCTSCIALLFPQLGWECFFDEPVMLLGFILLGRTLEQRARGQSAAAYEALLALQPEQARLVLDLQDPSKTILIATEQIRVGEYLQVLPGEQIPVDGEIVVGQSTLDESMLTGESIPVLKQPQEAVTAGTLNQSSLLVIRATRTGENTTLAKIIQLVETAQARKAPVQQLADTVAGYFTYGVLTAAALTFGFWYFWGTHLWPQVLENVPIHHHPMAEMMMEQSLNPFVLSLKLAISVLVIACPCALGLATPTAILVGTGLGAERGLLIKGGDVLQRVHQLDTVVFDKTGTLTTGYPEVTDCIAGEGISQAEVLRLAAAAEVGTIHPLAQAIAQASATLQLNLPPAQDYQTVPGYGIAAQIEGQQVYVGNQPWMEKNAISLPETLAIQAENLAQAGKTLVYVAQNDRLVGLIAARDALKPDAKETVQRLQSLGLKVLLLTGDRSEVAHAIAQQLALDDPQSVIANVRPSEKAAALQQLQSQGHQLAMVGDGINDAPALAQADVGIALQAGSDVALETAQIILMGNQLLNVVEAIRLSWATFGKIRQNLFWAFAYNTLAIPVAAGVLLPPFHLVLSPAVAGGLMAISSITVVSNSLLLRRAFQLPAAIRSKG